MSENAETKGVMIRPPLSVLQAYQELAGKQLIQGVATTHNKLMVEDLELLKGCRDGDPVAAAKLKESLESSGTCQVTLKVTSKGVGSK